MHTDYYDDMVVFLEQQSENMTEEIKNGSIIIKTTDRWILSIVAEILSYHGYYLSVNDEGNSIIVA